MQEPGQSSMAGEVAVMKAVVVYESMYGNTHEVAAHVAEGLRAAGAEVDLVHLGAASDELVRSADLLVVGGPTHAHAMTRATTRKAAVDQASAHDLVVEPDAAADGLREWFDAMPKMDGIAAAAFDTRLDAAKVLTGQASRGIRSRLRGHGFRMVAPAESFLVDKLPRLLPGEAERAVSWGRSLAEHATVSTDSAR
jgi:hypothetical protein